MTPVSSVLSRSASALLAGIALATLAVNLAPQGYYDAVEWRLADAALPGQAARAVTPAMLVADVLMAAFVFLLGKELWEALTRERGGFAGRAALAPGMMVAGGLVVPALVWTALLGAEAGGAALPPGSDTALAYLFGRRILGSGHPALQLLLFVCAASELAALVLTGFLALRGDLLHLAWLALPAAAALAGWALLTRRGADPLASERARSRALSPWPWLVPGVVSWVGVAAAGLPPALGLLPLLPAMPRAPHSFGLFAVAEAFLTDPANRIARRLRPALPPVLFLFGLTHGALDLAAADSVTWTTVAALWLGKPAGLLAGAFAARVMLDAALPPRRDLLAVALLSSLSFTAPALTIGIALPGGATAEAARLGFGLALLAGPAAVLAFARRRG
jgi:NhaA family Na+:H+ antiporter